MTKECMQTLSYRISQASRSDLVVILYDMADAYLADALGADTDQEYDNAIRKCSRTMDQLIKGLDFQYELSNQFFAIYLFIKKDLVKCIAGKDTEELQRIRGMIGKLRTSFAQVAKTDQSGPMMKNTQQVYSGLTYSAMGGSNEMTGNISSNRGFTV